MDVVNSEISVRVTFGDPKFVRRAVVEYAVYGGGVFLHFPADFGNVCWLGDC